MNFRLSAQLIALATVAIVSTEGSICQAAEVLFPDVTVHIHFKELRPANTPIDDLLQSIRDRSGRLCIILQQALLRECQMPEIKAPTEEFLIGARSQADFSVPLSLGAPVKASGKSQPNSDDFYDAVISFRQKTPRGLNLTEDRGKDLAKAELTKLSERIANALGRQSELWDFSVLNLYGQNPSPEITASGLISNREGKISHPVVIRMKSSNAPTH